MIKSGTSEMFFKNGIKFVNIYNDSHITFVGIGVLAGSNFETPDKYGISHFAEHMFFKGTKTRSWKALNEDFAMIGANNNAYTDNTEVLYHCTAPSKNIKKTTELMFDLFFNSNFSDEELEKERNVILEEKKTSDDDHTNFFYSTIGETMFPPDRGHRTIGTEKSIKSITSKDIIKYLDDNINLENLVIIFCGPHTIKEISNVVTPLLPRRTSHTFLKNGRLNTTSSVLFNKKFQYKSKNKMALKVRRDGITQSQICLPLEGLSASSSDFYAQKILFKCLGGGMYSILFSRIREELGLCYSVGSYVSTIAYPYCMSPMIYGSTSPKNVKPFISECENEIHKLIHKGVDKKIFECAKADLLSQMLRSSESSMGMGCMAVLPTLYGLKNTIAENIDRLEKTRISECNDVAKVVLRQHFNWATMLPK